MRVSAFDTFPEHHNSDVTEGRQGSLGLSFFNCKIITAFLFFLKASVRRREICLQNMVPPNTIAWRTSLTHKASVQGSV